MLKLSSSQGNHLLRSTLILTVLSGYLNPYSFGAEPSIVKNSFDANNWTVAAKESYRPITEDQLKESAQSVLSAIRAAETVLAELPNGGVIRRESSMASLENDLQQGSRDVAQYRKIYRMMARKMPKEAEAVMDSLRKSLWKHIGLVEWAAVADPKALFDHSIDQLHVALSAGEITKETSASVAEAYAWLAKSGLVDAKLSQARTVLSHTNQTIRLQKEIVDALLPKNITKSIPFDQKQDKIRVRGTANIEGKVAIQFVPNHHQAEFKVLIDGHGKIPITASAKLADVYAFSNLYFTGSLGMYVKSRGVELGDDLVCVQNKLNLQGVCLHLRSFILRKALTPIATRVLKKKLPEADQKIEDKLKSEVEKQLNENGDTIVDQLNAILNGVLWDTMDARDVDAQTRVSTTSSEFRWQDESILPTAIAAPHAAPGYGDKFPAVQFQLHESAVNNSSVVLSRRRYNEVLFRELVYGTLRIKPTVELDTQGGRIPAAFTFADEEPLRVTFEDDSFELRIRVKSFEWDGKLYDSPNQLAIIKYAVIPNEKQIDLVQQGPIQIEPTTENNGVLQQVLARFLVPQARVGRSMTIGNTNTTIAVSHLDIHRGWFQLGIDASK